MKYSSFNQMLALEMTTIHKEFRYFKNETVKTQTQEITEF